MISAPVLVAGRSNLYPSLVELFGEPEGDLWRVGTYDPGSGNYIEVSATRPAALEPGRAYWVGAVDPPVSWSVNGGASMPPDGALHYAVPLRPGWNMVGNPAPYSLTLDRSLLQVVNGDTLSFAAAASASNQWVASSILTFDPAGEGSYKNELITLPVWGGCWIKNRTAATATLLLPSAEALENTAFRSDANAAPIWSLELIASTADETGSVTIGIVPTESTTGSHLAFLPPRPPGSQLELSSVGSRPNADGEKLFLDLRSGDGLGAETWKVIVETEGGPAWLSSRWVAGSSDRPGTPPSGWRVQLRGPGGIETPAGRAEARTSIWCAARRTLSR